MKHAKLELYNVNQGQIPLGEAVDEQLETMGIKPRRNRIAPARTALSAIRRSGGKVLIYRLSNGTEQKDLPASRSTSSATGASR